MISQLGVTMEINNYPDCPQCHNESTDISYPFCSMRCWDKFDDAAPQILIDKVYEQREEYIARKKEAND